MKNKKKITKRERAMLNFFEDLANIEYTCPHCKKSGELFEREKKRMEIKGKKKTENNT